MQLPNSAMSISQNIAAIRERISHAAHRANRSPQEITLMAVTKTVGYERIKEAYNAELRDLLKQSAEFTHLEIRGLMAIPPFSEDTEAARSYFRRLRQLRDELAKASGLRLGTLSMGMSHDFEVAIEEGSTCVRIGMAIFGERPRH